MGKRAIGASGPSLSTWAKQKMRAVMKRRRHGSDSARERSLEEPSEEELLHEWGPDDRKDNHHHPPGSACGGHPQDRGSSGVRGAEARAGQNDADEHDQRHEATYYRALEPQPQILQPGPRQSVVGHQTARTVLVGRDGDGAHEANPEGELAGEEEPGLVDLDRALGPDDIGDGDDDGAGETHARADRGHTASLDARALGDERRGERHRYRPGLPIGAIDHGRPLRAVPPSPRCDAPWVPIPVGREYGGPRRVRLGCGLRDQVPGQGLRSTTTEWTTLSCQA